MPVPGCLHYFICTDYHSYSLPSGSLGASPRHGAPQASEAPLMLLSASCSERSASLLSYPYLFSVFHKIKKDKKTKIQQPSAYIYIALCLLPNKKHIHAFLSLCFDLLSLKEELLMTSPPFNEWVCTRVWASVAGVALLCAFRRFPSGSLKLQA